MTLLTRRSLICASLALAMGERTSAALTQEDIAASPQIPVYRGNAARTGEHPGPGPAGQPRALWDIRLGTKITSSPVFVGGVLYVGSAAPSTLAGGALHAVEASSGRELWRLSTGGGDAIFSSPAVFDGLVYTREAMTASSSQRRPPPGSSAGGTRLRARSIPHPWRKTISFLSAITRAGSMPLISRSERSGGGSTSLSRSDDR